MDDRLSPEPLEATKQNPVCVDQAESDQLEHAYDNEKETAEFSAGEVEQALDEEAILRRAARELVEQRAESRALAILELARSSDDGPLEIITQSLSDSSAAVRCAAVRAFYELNPERAASFLNNALREGSPEQRKQIGVALVGSGIIDTGNSTIQEPRTLYSALSLLFLLAKAGEVEPLMEVLQRHDNLQLRLALIKILGLSKAPEIVFSFQQLAMETSLPREVRSAVMEVLVQLDNAP